MGFIEVLQPELVNRIAAGECVERPASVVKELVENALDAGASRIDVRVLDGGRELIEVVDDGAGMDVDDLRRCILPHATSKIRTDDDLFCIHTMGFRGEALPSIGSVARLQITSRPRASDVAHRLAVEGGAVGEVVPCGAPAGTRVEVRDLFYCVPARRKFLKTTQTEMGHISEQFARLALAHPNVAFSLKHNKRTFHQLPATDDRRKRIGDFYGPELADVLLPIRRAGNGVLVEGWVAPPKESRGSGKWEYVFVNGRYVRDRFVSHAIKEAYRSLIDPSRYPVAFLFLTIDPDQVDVNVHPTKSEVRWRDSNYVHGQVLAALRERFLATNLDHTLATQAAAEDAYRGRVRQAMVDFFTSRPAGVDVEPRGGGSSGKRFDAGASAFPREGHAATARPADHMEASAQRSAGGGETCVPGAPPGEFSAQPTAEPANRSDAHRQPADALATGGSGDAPPRAIQLHNTFIVAETGDGLMIIDQHALHERILYERFRARIADHALEAQRLLLPEVVRVPADRIETLETHAELLARLGIELTASGPQSVTVHAFPTFLHKLDAARFVRDLLDVLSEKGARPSPETLLHELLDMMACKAAVKAGDPLTHEEITDLLRHRELAERSSHCPHGRPTTLHLTLRDLERQFKRR